jgi:hypothetical protein
MGQLLFKKCFWEPIRSGTKRTTLRRWDRPRVRAGERAFSPGLGWLAIVAVDEVADLSTLTDADARADGFASRDELLNALLSIYPNHETDGRRWFRVGFERQDCGLRTE